MKENLSFAIFGCTYQTKPIATTQLILDLLKVRGASVSIDREYYKFLRREKLRLDGVTAFDSQNFQADVVISMGGDGTFLEAAARVGSRCIPIMGVNMGRLGFLADISRDEVTAAIDDIYAGHYTIEEHAVICVDCEGTPIPGSPFALNDIAVLKRDDASMISIRTSVDNDYLVTYQADGLVVSTPTGSTAYSLSNGGPIVWPRADVLCLTPVAPHSMNIRPMVLPDTSVITLDVVSRSHQFLVAVDGRSARCTEGTTLTIRRAAYTIHILKRQGQTYFRTLREKMMWGKDVR